MNTSMIVYRLFDVADEIDLDLVQALWTSRNKIASRLRLDRISTKSITFKDPPVLVELGSHDMKLGNGTYLTEVKARIFDLGVISLILRIHFEDDVTFDEYMDMSIVSENMPEDEIRSYLDAVLETIRPALSNERVSDFDEDFVVYYFQDKVPEGWDIVPLLLKDRTPVSEQTREDTLSNRFSYADDVCYLAWDSAVVYDPTGSLDVPDLLEFANAQFLELRYYDNALNNAIDRTYDELEAAEKGSTGSRQTSYRKIRGRLMELMADVSTLTSNINNALQVTEDIFYARIYTRYLDLLRASVWKDNIENKLLVIQRSYNLLNEEVSMYRFEFIGMCAVTLLGIILLLIIYLAVR
ncbi:MAG: hypothetical protein DBY32_06095 [Phascolarctobacterium sp.]|nr:MAG: hypothetical protein DBY32_06095 [Phascolarctobacterium sp.]